MAELTDEAMHNRPTWTDVFGHQPAESATRLQWRRHLGVVAAHRDQHIVTDDDPRRPLGRNIGPDSAGRHAYWHAAAAIVHAPGLTEPSYTIRPRPRGDADSQTAAGHQIAVDTYLGLPTTERAAIAKHMVVTLGNLWYGNDGDLDSGITQPVYGVQLTAALARHGHLGESRPVPIHGDEWHTTPPAN